MEKLGNKPQQYVEKSRLYIHKGKLQKAYKCVSKIDCLFSTAESKELLINLKIQIEEKKKRSEEKFNEKLQKMKKSGKSNFTQETANVVHNLRNGDNYYVMLGTKNTATIRRIKKAYKKVLLLLHAVDNSADIYAELFVDLKKAYNTLRNSEKRQEYDLSLECDSTFALPMYEFSDPE